MGPNTSYRKNRYPDRAASRNVIRIPYARTLMFPTSQMTVGMPRYRRQPAQQMRGRENMDWTAIHAQATANMTEAGLQYEDGNADIDGGQRDIDALAWRRFGILPRAFHNVGGHRCVCHHRWAYHLHADFRSAYRIPPAG